MPNTLSRQRVLFIPFQKDFRTSRQRHCFARVLLDFVRYGFQGSSPEEGWASMALGLLRMLPFKWRGIGKSKCTLPREMRGIRSWRWNEEPRGPAARLMTRG